MIGALRKGLSKARGSANPSTRQVGQQLGRQLAGAKSQPGGSGGGSAFGGAARAVLNPRGRTLRGGSMDSPVNTVVKGGVVSRTPGLGKISY